MLSKIVPVAFFVVGIGSGIAAGVILQNPVSTSSSEKTQKLEEPADKNDKTEFVKIANQFVVPVVEEEKVIANVVMSITLEVEPGARDAVYAREPKLRATFLRVLFDHANIGGFHGSFTSPEHLDPLRGELLDVSTKEVGPEVRDVLIVDIARQDVR